MQIATIVPTHYLPFISGNTYHMALAHLVGTDGEYTDFYRQEARQGSYVILDNGVIENAQQSITDICWKAGLIGANEIILPDVFLNKQATLEKSLEAFMYVRQSGIKVKVMAVPQGETIEEWEECLDVMLSWGVDCIGIPKVLTKLGGRDARLGVLRDMYIKYGKIDPEIHLLGCWETPLECTMISKAIAQGDIQDVRGVDSAIAYIYSKAGLIVSHDARPEGKVDFNDNTTNVTLLRQNIHIWEKSVDLVRGKVIELF